MDTTNSTNTTDSMDTVAHAYDDALRMSREAFAGRHYEMAFHALGTALHAAFDLGDEARLCAVGALAREQGAWLDAHESTHGLSAPSAAGRGSRSLWDVMSEEAQTRQRLLIHRRHLQQTHPQAQP